MACVWPMRAWWWVLLVIAVPRSAWAQSDWLRVGDDIEGWRIESIDARPDVYRLELTGEPGTTALEVRPHSGGADPLATKRHRLSAPPAGPGVPPPKVLMDAVLERLRAYDDAGGPPLCSGQAKEGRASPTRDTEPRRTADAPARGPPGDAAEVLGFDTTAVGLPGQWPWSIHQRYPFPAWPWLCLLIGLAWVALRRQPATRAWLLRLNASVERRAWWWLGAVLLGMAALRAPHLDAPFTFDALTQRLLFGSLDLGDILAHRYADQRHPQLFYLVLHLFLRFGHGEAVARLPAVLFSLAAAATLFAVARPALGSAGALFATVLLGLNVSFLTFSREVGDLTLFTFLVLLSTLLLLRSLERPQWTTVAGFTAAEGAMFYAYYLAPLVTCAHAAVLLVHGRSRRLRALWGALAVALLLAVPSLWDLTALIRSDTGVREVARAFPKHVWGERSIVELWAQLGVHLAPSAELLVLSTALAVLGAFRLARRPWRDPVALVAVVILAVATIVVGLAVPLVRLKPYYLLFILPFLLLLVVAGCVGRRRRQDLEPRRPSDGNRPWGADLRAGCGASLLALLAGGSAADLAMRLDVTYLPRDPPRFREMGARIRQEPGPRIVIADPNALHTILLYYLFPEPLEMYRSCFIAPGGGTQCHRGDHHLITLTVLPYMTAGWDERSRERFDEARSLGPSWVVYSEHFENHLLHAELQASCTLAGAYGDYGALSLYRCPAWARTP